MHLLGSLVVFLLIALPARAGEPLTSVPYRVGYTGWFTIEVSVNGQGPYDFIIDTGATQSLVFQNLATQMQFAPTGGPDQTVLGLASEGAFAPFYVGDIKIGAVHLDDLVTVILPDWKVENRPQGVIGLDLLRKFITVFDAQAGLIHFYNPEDPPEEIERWKSVRIKPDNFGLDANFLYTMEARLNSQRVRFLLDLGASGTLVNRDAVESIVKRGISLAIRPTNSDSRITDALERTKTVQGIVVRRFQLGRTYWRRQLIGVQNAPIFEELGVQDEPFGMFGADLIRDYSFALDFEGEHFFLGPKGTAPR